MMPQSPIFNVAIMSLNSIRESKMLAKTSEFTEVQHKQFFFCKWPFHLFCEIESDCFDVSALCGD